MTLSEKSSYIKGLAEGLEYDKTSKEGKIISALIDLVSDMAEELEQVNDDLCDLSDYIEEVDEDLADVEDFLDEECDGDCENCECEGDCEDCEYGDDDYDDDNSEFYEVECPSCGETVNFDESIDPENLICPSCGKKFSCKPDDEE